MKTVWIIDGAYLFSAAPGRLDYLKLKGALTSLSGEDIFEGYYLNSSYDPPTDAQSAFNTWLKTAAPNGPKLRVQLYKLKSMRVRCNACYTENDKQVQKGVDVGIATLTIKLACQNRYDRLLLAAGDGDFEDAIDYVKSELHKEIWICGFKNTVSADLQSYADRVIWLDDIWSKIEKPL